MIPHLCKKYDEKPRGDFQKNWVGVCGTILETLTLFQTKIRDFPNPISDLIKNLIPYFSPGARRVTPVLLHVHGWRKQ